MLHVSRQAAHQVANHQAVKDHVKLLLDYILCQSDSISTVLQVLLQKDLCSKKQDISLMSWNTVRPARNHVLDIILYDIDWHSISLYIYITSLVTRHIDIQDFQWKFNSNDDFQRQSENMSSFDARPWPPSLRSHLLQVRPPGQKIVESLIYTSSAMEFIKLCH